MVAVEHLLQPAKNISQRMIDQQRLTVRKAYEVLTEYPHRAAVKGGKWKIYKRLRGVMLADEVGMGKTFEALALATKMYLEQTPGRRNRFRVLILASPAIQSKWEWCGPGLASRPTKKRENHDEYSMCRPSCNRYGDCDNSGPVQHDVGVFLKALRLKRRKNHVQNLLSSLCLHRIRSKEDWWNHVNRRPGNQAVFLAGIQTLPTPYGKDKSIAFKRSGGRRESFPLDENFFDLIIADEAHIARTGFEVEGENRLSTTALRKIKAILNHSRNAYILLLTATPFQNHSGEFKRLLELLEYGNVLKQNDKTVIQCIKESLDNTHKTYNELLSCVRINNINAVDEGRIIKSLYAEADLDFDQDPNTNFRPWELTNRKTRILEGLDDYLRDVVTRNRRKRIVPNIHPVEISSNQKTVLHYLLSRDLVAKDEDREADPLFTSVTLSELVSSEGAFSQSFQSPLKRKKISDLSETFGEYTIFEMKKTALVDLLTRLQNDRRVVRKPVITVFFRFLKSIDSVEKYLGKYLKDRIIWKFTGKDPRPPLRKAKLEEIQGKCNDSKVLGILLVSQVGNEGLDFDSFSNTIIHFDGHYNPAVMDQRNGRVYRNKNKARDIKIYRLQVQDTYDQKISYIEWEKRKLKDFYLGDKSLGRLIEEVPARHLSSEWMRKIWQNFTVNLEPKKAHLLRKGS